MQLQELLKGIFTTGVAVEIWLIVQELEKLLTKFYNIFVLVPPPIFCSICCMLFPAALCVINKLVRPRWPYDMRPSVHAEKYMCVIVIR